MDPTKTPAHSPLHSYLAVLPGTQEPSGYQAEIPNHRGWRAGLSNKGCNGEQEVEGAHRQLPPRLAETLLTSEWLRCSAGERARLACDPRTNLEQHLSLWRLWSTRLRGGYASSNVPGGLGVQERPSKTPLHPFTGRNLRPDEGRRPPRSFCWPGHTDSARLFVVQNPLGTL